MVFHTLPGGRGGQRRIPEEKIVTQGCLDSWEILEEAPAGAGPKDGAARTHEDKQGPATLALLLAFSLASAARTLADEGLDSRLERLREEIREEATGTPSG